MYFCSTDHQKLVSAVLLPFFDVGENDSFKADFSPSDIFIRST
jgi:hypothetical protein